MTKANYFKRTGGIVLGEASVFELGRLLRAPSVPKLAYVRGNPELLSTQPCIGIVGTRKPSVVGTKRAFDYAARFASEGFLVISGGAIGIDLAAHQGALSVGAQTLVVLGDPIYEAKDERPARILALKPSNLLSTVTVFGPETQLGKTLFVARNQYIAALSDAIVIVEGTLNSGTLHTARYAEKINVPVWVVPGDPENPLASAANFLLQEQRARALLDIQVLINQLRPSTIKPPFNEKESRPVARGPLGPVFQAYNNRVTLDLLCDTLQLSVSQIQSNLLELELMGLVVREGAEFVWQNRL